MEIKVTDIENNEKLAVTVENRNTYIVNGYKFFLVRRMYLNGNVRNEFYNNTPLSANLPSIGKRCIDYRTGEEEYVIGCIGCGSMNPSELQYTIGKYQMALETIEWLNGFDWNKTDIIVQNK
ncbi:MAG: hypothetical protein II937_09500 [Bacteroidales bacterium]|nr:hypothetical protein [Bacteroidales bacterium]